MLWTVIVFNLSYLYYMNFCVCQEAVDYSLKLTDRQNSNKLLILTESFVISI